MSTKSTTLSGIVEPRKKIGRPKGSISNHTRKGIVAREAFAKLVEQNLQPLFNALFAKAMDGDVQALKELLDRAWGRPNQSMDVNKTVVHLSLAELAERTKHLELDGNGDVRLIKP